MIVMVVMMVTCVAGGDVSACPDLPGQLGDSQDLDISSLSLSVQPQDVSCKCSCVRHHIVTDNHDNFFYTDCHSWSTLPVDCHS